MDQSLEGRRRHSRVAGQPAHSHVRRLGLARTRDRFLCRLVPSLFCVFIGLGSRIAAAQDPASETALASQQEGLAFIKQSRFEQALGAFSRAYYLSRGHENLLAMAYCEDRLKRFGSASLLLRQLRGLMGKEGVAAARIGDISFSPSEVETVDEQKMGKVSVKLLLAESFKLENVQLYVDGQPLITAAANSPTDVVLTPLPTELAYLARLKLADADGHRRQGAARSRHGEIAASTAAKRETQQDAKPELADQAFLATLVPPPLASTSLTLLLDPGQHSVQLRDKSNGFAPYNVPNGVSVHEGAQNPILTIDPNNRYAVLAVKLPDLNKKDGESEADENTPTATSSKASKRNPAGPQENPNRTAEGAASGQVLRDILLEVRNIKGKLVAQPRRVSSTTGQLSIEVPPNVPSGTGYSLIATLSGGDFLPFQQDNLLMRSGEQKEVDVRFRVRPLYRKWAFWTYLAVGVAAIGGAVGGGITGYNRAHTFDGGTSNWVVHQ